jgi:hypothetical protein
MGSNNRALPKRVSRSSPGKAEGAKAQHGGTQGHWSNVIRDEPWAPCQDLAHLGVEISFSL